MCCCVVPFVPQQVVKGHDKVTRGVDARRLLQSNLSALNESAHLH